MPGPDGVRLLDWQDPHQAGAAELNIRVDVIELPPSKVKLDFL